MRRQGQAEDLTGGIEMAHGEPLFPSATRQLVDERRRLAPGTAAAFRAFSQSVFADGALSAKTKQLIAVAAAHVTQCPYCIRSHTRQALQRGASSEEIMEAIWVAAEMRAGAAYAHSLLALDTIAHHDPGVPSDHQVLADVPGRDTQSNNGSTG